MGLSWTKSPARERREARRRDAERRQAEHDSMTGWDKLAKIGARRGASERERRRIIGAPS